MCHKLRRAMVDPDREPLGGIVEIDETSIVCRTKDEPVAGGQGRSSVGKILVVGAVELLEDGRPGRARLARIPDFQAVTLHRFVGQSVERGSTVVSDGLQAYRGLRDVEHERRVVGGMAAHILMPWIHRVFSNFKRWALGTLHGLRKQHVDRYLNEFVFRWNRRAHRRAAFDTLLGLATRYRTPRIGTSSNRPSEPPPRARPGSPVLNPRSVDRQSATLDPLSSARQPHPGHNMLIYRRQRDKPSAQSRRTPSARRAAGSCSAG